MKKVHYLFTVVLVLFYSCRKYEPVPEPTASKEITNTILAGNNCTSFERLIKGSQMEDLTAVKQTADGGYIFCGSTETIAENEYDILVIKTDCSGKTEWMKTISNNYTDVSYDITPISTGGYLITASFSDAPNINPFNSYQGQLIKLNGSGSMVWKRTCNIGFSTSLYKVLETSDGGFVICGTDESQGGFILKTDSSGAQTWIKNLGSLTNLCDMSINSANHYIGCGSVSIDGLEDIFLTEINQSGDTVWTKHIDKDNLTNEALSIVTLSNNEIIIGGYTRTSGTGLPGFVMRLNNTGGEIWYKPLAAEGISSFGNVVSTSDNQILGTGSKISGLTLVKLNAANGGIIWTSDKSLSPDIRDLRSTSDGGFILAGNLFMFAHNRDGYILKTNQNGN